LQQQKKPQEGVEKKDSSEKGANLNLQECNKIMSYTELLTAPSCVVYDEHMF
jgi:hypothetical protein